jgi:hypothetical protein
MRRKYDMPAIGHLIQFLDKYRALGLQTVDDKAVVHNFMAHIYRRAMLFERKLYNLNGAVHASAKTAWCRQKQREGFLGDRLFSHRQCPLVKQAASAKTFPLLHVRRWADKDQCQRRTRNPCTVMPRITYMKFAAKVLTFGIVAATLAGCSREGDLDIGAGVGVNVTRSGCPAVAVPDGTGDITLFNPSDSQDASAIDVVASITNIRPTCSESGEKIFSQASFDVQARRSDTQGSRTVILPYFTTVVQGGSAVVAKRVGQVTLQFADGQQRASASAQAASYIDKASASLPAEIVQKITKKRKPGDPDAALDPMAAPEVRAAVVRSSFEMLIGFQLTEDQLRYNVTR